MNWDDLMSGQRVGSLRVAATSPAKIEKFWKKLMNGQNVGILRIETPDPARAEEIRRDEERWNALIARHEAEYEALKNELESTREARARALAWKEYLETVPTPPRDQAC